MTYIKKTMIVCISTAILVTLLANVAKADSDLLQLLTKIGAQTDNEKKDGAVTKEAGDTPIPVSQNLKNGLTDAQKARALYLHNYYRSKEGASNMNKLVWSDKLANMAQEWSKQCIFKHRALGSPGGAGYVNPDSVGFPGEALGENLWVGSANKFVMPDVGIEGWYNEKKDYTYSSMYCRPGKMCGHYLAVTWGPTVAVGCGFAQCNVRFTNGDVWKQGVMFTCNYAPGVLSQTRPFNIGQPCTECSSGKMFCTNSLCDNSCTGVGYSGTCECNIQCDQGTVDSNTCSCRCNAGYTGTSCSDVCQDKNNYCNNGWPPSFCDKEQMMADGYLNFHYQVVAECPLMCGKCESASRENELAKSQWRVL